MSEIISFDEPIQPALTIAGLNRQLDFLMDTQKKFQQWLDSSVKAVTETREVFLQKRKKKSAKTFDLDRMSQETYHFGSTPLLDMCGLPEDDEVPEKQTKPRVNKVDIARQLLKESKTGFSVGRLVQEVKAKEPIFSEKDIKRFVANLVYCIDRDKLVCNDGVWKYRHETEKEEKDQAARVAHHP